MSSVADRPKELLISTARTDSDGVLLAVHDSGSGIDPANLERVFEAFYSTKPGGMGMGLSICRAIIEAHGGRLWATHGMRRGAVFQFTLPRGSEGASR
jgi:signal transduction histidine kinase